MLCRSCAFWTFFMCGFPIPHRRSLYMVSQYLIWKGIWAMVLHGSGAKGGGDPTCRL